MTKPKYGRVLSAVLERITPDPSVKRKCEKVLSEIKAEIRKARILGDAVLGGSIAKGTFLRDDYDCDIFVRFEIGRYKDKDISSILGKALSKFSPQKVKGSRDYYQFERDWIHFEIVPVLKIRKPGEAVNVIDVSPMHSAWIRKRLSAKKGLSDEVRLARAFCKGIGVYGAESFISGFSGHVIDIMTIYYGGFIKLLSASQKWDKKVVIDPENHQKGRALFNLNTSKTAGPLVLVDPVQPDRNAAASLSPGNMKIFRKEAKKFLKSPSESFFREKALDIGAAPGKIVIMAFSIPGNKDVSGCKVKKAFEFIREKLEANGFLVKRSAWQWDQEKKAHFVYFIYKNSLNDAAMRKGIIRRGPPVSLKEHAAAFRRKYRKVFGEEGFLWAEVPRKYTSPEKLLAALSKEAYLKDKIKGFKIL